MRVHYIHGLESGPRGSKARWLAERFETRVPQMDTSDFPACVALQAQEIAAFAPDVVIGSSFGGAVTLTLLHRGAWRGPTLLLAPAVRFLPSELRVVPPGARVLVVHGTRDEIVPIEGSRRLGAPLVELDDEHRLVSLLERDTFAELVKRATLSAG